MVEKYVVVTIVQHPSHVGWSIRQVGTPPQSGTDPLSGTNGCYMSLVSNVLTDCSNRCSGPVDEWIFRRG